jgi:hypothetical protein
MSADYKNIIERLRMVASTSSKFSVGYEAADAIESLSTPLPLPSREVVAHIDSEDLKMLLENETHEAVLSTTPRGETVALCRCDAPALPADKGAEEPSELQKARTETHYWMNRLEAAERELMRLEEMEQEPRPAMTDQQIMAVMDKHWTPDAWTNPRATIIAFARELLAASPQGAALPSEEAIDRAIAAYDTAWNPANRGRDNKAEAILAACAALQGQQSSPAPASDIGERSAAKFCNAPNCPGASTVALDASPTAPQPQGLVHLAEPSLPSDTSLEFARKMFEERCCNRFPNSAIKRNEAGDYADQLVNDLWLGFGEGWIAANSGLDYRKAYRPNEKESVSQPQGQDVAGKDNT